MQNEDTYNRGGFYAFLFSMVFSLGFFAYITFVYQGVDLREVPEEEAAAEQTVAGGDGAESAAEQAIDVSAVQDPWIYQDSLAAHGKVAYQASCAVCHGAQGKGDGPAGAGLVPPPRNLVEGNWTQGGSAIELFQTISNGIEGTSMAAFAHLPVVDRWALVHYIHSITENKVETDPEKLKEFAQSVK